MAVLDALAVAYPSRRVFAECRPENTGSWRLLVRMGFAPVGAVGRRAGRMRLALQQMINRGAMLCRAI